MTLSVGDKLAKVWWDNTSVLITGEAHRVFEVERVEWINEGYDKEGTLQTRLLVKLKVVE